MSGSFEVDSNNDVVVSWGALDPSPELKLLIVIFMTQFEDARLKGDQLLCRKGGPNTVEEF